MPRQIKFYVENGIINVAGFSGKDCKQYKLYIRNVIGSATLTFTHNKK